MRFVLLQELDAPGGSPPPASRYAEVVKEGQRAEEVGWHTVALSEQHFNHTLSTGSSPESFLGYMAAATDQVRLRFASIVLLPFNHPVRIAERVATLDILSDGRIDLGTARSNNPGTLKSFGVDPGDTRAMWDESAAIIEKALTEEVFEHDGPEYKIPPTSITPRPVQQPMPPMHVSAASAETHRKAGRRGIGVMTGNSLAGGWQYLEDSISEYRAGQAEFDGDRARFVNCTGALALLAHCAEDSETARREAAELVGRGIALVGKWFEGLVKATTDYAAMAPFKEVIDRREDLEFLIDRSPYISIGDPDFFIERCRKLEQMGYDEFIVRVDGMGHEKNMQTIELFGEHVIPALS